MNRTNISDPQVPFTPAMLTRCQSRPRYNAMFGAQWERNVYKGLHDCVESREDGWVTRLYKPKFSAQVIDILVDGVDGEFYAVECKSTTKILTYPTMWFGKKIHGQLQEETAFLRRSGRIGIIAFLMPVLFPYGVGFRAYLIPWQVYLHLLYGSGRSTAGDLDALASLGLILRIPTGNGVVELGPDVFQKIQTAMLTFETKLQAAKMGDAW